MTNKQDSLGLIQVFTGDGKGKTTAALGEALRACGHNFKVLVVQFMKGQIKYGEVRIASKVPNLTLKQFGLPTFVKKGAPSKEDLRLAHKGLEFAKSAIMSKKYDMVILDEVNVAIDYGLIKLEDVLKILKEKPKGIEIIITGRYAPKEIIEMADLVSRIEEVKHPYQKGILARKGVEW
ncbi:MAG: cob(I)yrinic acid a,c-diamide adenosyltransferase [Candidatus Cloacimonas sp. 4484_209]|nr:MAG: cob(I)yrinic acid a,c-diamide adenosyltransferase [Candidatus Cloacimonas sp. 4484_209]